MRPNPYRNFKFKVYIDGILEVGGFTRVSGLGQDTEVISYREGGDNRATRKLIGATDYAPIVLERGIVGNELALWAAMVHNVVSDFMPEELIKQSIRIDLLGKDGKPVKSWSVFRCWPSHYEVSEFNAMNSGIAVESIVLQNEGSTLIPI